MGSGIGRTVSVKIMKVVRRHSCRWPFVNGFVCKRCQFLNIKILIVSQSAEILIRNNVISDVSNTVGFEFHSSSTLQSLWQLCNCYMIVYRDPVIRSSDWLHSDWTLRYFYKLSFLTIKLHWKVVFYLAFIA